jgi:hypothetical protein
MKIWETIKKAARTHPYVDMALIMLGVFASLYFVYNIAYKEGYKAGQGETMFVVTCVLGIPEPEDEARCKEWLLERDAKANETE